MPQRNYPDIRQWAVMGAERRLEQIEAERAAIQRAFPELRARRRGRPRGPAGRDETTDGVDGAAEPDGRPRRRRRKLSAAARKRISDAQKTRWAKWKAQTAGVSAAGGKKR